MKVDSTIILKELHKHKAKGTDMINTSFNIGLDIAIIVVETEEKLETLMGGK